MDYWLAVGPVDNWKIGVEQGVWGFPATYKKHWELVGVGDILVFYVTAPVRGAVGYGTIVSKKVERTAIWPEEKALNSALWPLRLGFETRACLRPQDWKKKSIHLKGRMASRRSFQRLRDEIAKELVSQFSSVTE